MSDLVYTDPEMYNNRARVPISRIFNATLKRDLEQLLVTIKNLEQQTDVIWWKVVRQGDKYYITGQRHRPTHTNAHVVGGGGSYQH